MPQKINVPPLDLMGLPPRLGSPPPNSVEQSPDPAAGVRLPPRMQVSPLYAALMGPPPKSLQGPPPPSLQAFHRPY